MRISAVIVAVGLLSGCTTPPPRLSQDPIVNWFHVGQAKGLVFSAADTLVSGVKLKD